MDLEALRANYRPMNLKAATPAQPQKKKKNFLVDNISTIGGIGGGILGAAGGILGVGAGSAVGSGLGEAIENAIMGEKLTNNVGKTAAIDGLLAAGPIRALKAGVRGAKAATSGGSLVDALKGTATGTAKKTGTSRLKEGASDRLGEGMGVKIGEKMDGKLIQPKDAEELAQWRNGRAKEYAGGYTVGAPRQQAKQAERVHDEVAKRLNTELDRINRPLATDERMQVTAALGRRVADDAGLTGIKEITDNFRKKIVAARDVKELEAIRKEAQDLAYKNNGANGDSLAARQAEHVRDSIDEYVTTLDDTYKTVKGDYRNAKRSLDKASTNNADPDAGGLKVPTRGGNMRLMGQAGVGIKNKINAKIAGISTKPTATGTQAAKNPYGKLPIATRVGGGNLLIDALQGEPQQPEMPIEEAPLEDPNLMTDPSLEEPTTNDNPFAPENLETNVAMMLQNGASMKEINEYVGLAETINKMTGGSKPMKLTETQRARDDAAQLTDEALAMLDQGSINTGFVGGNLERGKAFFGKADPESLEFNVLSSNLRATIAKARAGTAMSEGHRTTTACADRIHP